MSALCLSTKRVSRRSCDGFANAVYEFACDTAGGLLPCCRRMDVDSVNPLLERAVAAAQGSCPTVYSLLQAATTLGGAGTKDSLLALLQVLARARQRVWDDLHTTPWHSTPTATRHLYAAVARAEARCVVSLHQITQEPVDAASGDAELLPSPKGADTLGHEPRTTALQSALLAAIRCCDVALMLCCPGDRAAVHGDVDAYVAAALANAPAASLARSTITGLATLQRRLDACVSAPLRLPELLSAKRIPELLCPSIMRFADSAFAPRHPVLLHGVLDTWPASRKATSSGPAPRGFSGASGDCSAGDGSTEASEATAPSHSWSDVGYWLSVAGMRTVPVEVGGHYMAEGWGTRLVAFGQYLRYCVAHTERVRAAWGEAGASDAAVAAAAAAEHAGSAAAANQQQAADTCCESSCSAGDGCDLGAAAGAASPAAAAAAPATCYLAQHRLLDQIPVLAADIAVPDYCSLRDGDAAAGAAEASGTHEGAPDALPSPVSGLCEELEQGQEDVYSAPCPRKRRRFLPPDAADGGSGPVAGERIASGAFQEAEVGATVVARPASAELRTASGCDSRAAAAHGEAAEEEAEEEADVCCNAWVGPAGTVSCLHFDAPHNLLAQVVGWKRVLLYAPVPAEHGTGCPQARAASGAEVAERCTSSRHASQHASSGAQARTAAPGLPPPPSSPPACTCMYPHEGINANTSRVDPLALHAARRGCSPGGSDSGHSAERSPASGASDGGESDDEGDRRLPARFHSFPAAPVYDVLLPPGSMLYIPPRWWHHVTALALSVSVSFWWAASSRTTGPGMWADHAV